MTLHDLSPWMNRGWHHAADRVRRRTPLLIRLGIATMVVTDSEAVRRQAIDYFRIHPDRIARCRWRLRRDFGRLLVLRRPSLTFCMSARWSRAKIFRC